MPASTCVILVPGFKGSILAAGKAPVWITAGQALFGHASLACDRPDLGVPNPLALADGGILEHVTVIPGLFKSDVYGSTIRALRAALPAGWELRAWHYDWRRDADALVRELDGFVAGVLASGVGDVRIVAHSMGAMLTAAWLLRPGSAAGAAARVSHVAFAAGAFRGTTKVFRNLQTGDEPSGRNATLLSAPAMGSFPSIYAFIPDTWPFVVDAKGTPVASDFRDVALWEGGRWGLFRDGRADVAGARRAFLTERFAASREFLRGIADPAAQAPKGLRVHSVLGTGVGTIDRLIRRDDGTLVVNEAERKAEPALAALSLEVPGDGTIPAHGAELPPGLAARAVGETLRVPATEHMAIVQGGAGLAATLRFITRPSA
ncbi:MAG: esterase/lipase family protein [Gemmatimonadales bacterium]